MTSCLLLWITKPPQMQSTLKRKNFSYKSKFFPFKVRSSGSLVGNMLDYQPRDHVIDPGFSGLSDKPLNQGPISI